MDSKVRGSTMTDTGPNTSDNVAMNFVTYAGALHYADTLGNDFDLPSSAEWEVAAASGEDTIDYSIAPGVGP
jgi:formylglycine-generating enzyme required for sulfatase activity